MHVEVSQAPTLRKKLQLKPGMKIKVLAKPRGLEFGDLDFSAGQADALLLFVTTLAEVDDKSAPIVAAAKADGLAWIAYPKAGQLGTDLNRDLLSRHLERAGVQPVRQVALDDVWSAMRFRPAT